MLSVDSVKRPTVADLMSIKIIKMRMKEKDMRSEYQKIKARETDTCKKIDSIEAREAGI
jgi:hypothetical protein